MLSNHLVSDCMLCPHYLSAGLIARGQLSSLKYGVLALDSPHRVKSLLEVSTGLDYSSLFSALQDQSTTEDKTCLNALMLIVNLTITSKHCTMQMSDTIITLKAVREDFSNADEIPGYRQEKVA